MHDQKYPPIYRFDTAEVALWAASTITSSFVEIDASYEDGLAVSLFEWPSNKASSPPNFSTRFSKRLIRSRSSPARPEATCLLFGFRRRAGKTHSIRDF